jgi:hypothetical protein
MEFTAIELLKECRTMTRGPEGIDGNIAMALGAAGSTSVQGTSTFVEPA